MKQRTSTRQVKLSKAFRVVDEETRKSAREQRLLTLEADNYNESELTGDRDDDAFDSDVSDSSELTCSLFLHLTLVRLLPIF